MGERTVDLVENISIEEYLERRQARARGSAEKEEHAKQVVLHAGITEWSDLFYT